MALRRRQPEFHDMPMRGELPTVRRRRFARASKRASKAGAAWSGLIAQISNPNLQAVAMFCAIGLLATLNVLLRVPLR
jgi:hypothetical protein